jgi:apolipoprotein N-acyltransferase
VTASVPDRVRPASGAALASLAAGAASTLAFAPFGAWWLAPFALAALLALLSRVASPLRAALVGFAFGLGSFGTGVSWVYVSLHVHGSMPAPMAAIATAGFCAYLALYPAAAAAFVALTPRGLWRFASFPAAWTVAEWLRGWVLTGFTWQSIGYSQAGGPLAGWAPVAGLYAMTLATAASGAALWWLGRALLARLAQRGMGAVNARPSPIGTTVAAALLVLPWIAGAVLLRVEWTRPAGEPVEVALLQGNVPQELKWREDRVAPTLETYLRLVEAGRGAKLIVMPETAMPLFADRLPADYVEQLAAVAREGGGDLLLGAVERAEAPHAYRNAVFSLGQSPTQAYRKEHLVPFGEFIPPLFGWVLDWLSIPLQDFAPGSREQRPLALGSQRVAVNICYEDSFSRVILRQLPEATLLVNVSNTAWFGRSLAQPQHLQIAQLRALETGRPMLRATNTGMTAMIDPRGRVLALADPFTEAALRVRVQGHEGATPFVHIGNAPAVALAALLALVALGMGRRRRA